MVSFFSFGGNQLARNKLTNGLLLRNDTIVSYNSAAIGSNAFYNGGLNFTSVGTNGKSSYYGTFDQTGLVWEWCDGNSTTKIIRGGDIAGFGGYSNKYDADKTKRYTKTVAGGDTNPPSFLDSPNRAKGKPQDQDWGGRIVSLTNPLNLDNYVTVGDINNTNDSTGYGGVSYSYKISRYLLTNDEYCAFLNLKAISDPNKLYSTQMSSERVGGISRSGSSGSYNYSVKTNMGNKPVYFLSWFSLARYCNWLHNGKGSGSTETGAYTLNNALTGIISKNTGANYYIPTENEWYKAAYYKGGSTNAGYWSFATQNNSVPTPVAASLIGDGTVKNVSIKPISAVGSNVSISGVSDTIYNTTIGLTYQQVSSSGITKITPVTQNDPKLPVNFSLSNNLAKYNISTTSARSGNIDLCFTLPSSITSTVFNKTKIFHTDSKGVTKDITITSGANAPNYSTRTICGRSTSFSDFHIVPSNDVAAYPIPTSVSGVPGNGKIDLSWSISDTTDIFDYDVKFSADSGNSWTTFQHSSTTGSALSIDSLVNNTAYVFSVAAVGVSGVGDYSTTSPSFTPVPSVPDVVTGVSAVAGTNNATVSWNVPNNNGSNITSYSVQYSSDSGSSWSSSNDPLYLFSDDVSTTRSLTVTNLSAIPYVFRVAAVNGTGSGSYSSSSSSITPTDAAGVTPTPTPTPTTTITNTPTSSNIPVTPTPTPTVTTTPSSSPAAANNGIIIQSSVSSTPRALVGGGATYNPTFINSDYRQYYSQIVDRWNYTISNGRLPYDNIWNNYYLFNGGRTYYFNFMIPTVLTKYRLWNPFKANIPCPGQYGPYAIRSAVTGLGSNNYLDFGNQTPQSWKIQGSNDDINWVDVDIRTNQPRLPYATSDTTANSAYGEFSVDSPTAYKSYKFIVTGTGRDGWACNKSGCSYDWVLGEIQLWGYESPSSTSAIHGYYSCLPSIKYLNASQGLDTSSFKKAFFQSGGLGGDDRNKWSVYQNGTQNRVWYNYYWDIPYKAIGATETAYFGFDYGVIINSYSIKSITNQNGGLNSISSWDIYGSNDFSSWSLLDSRSGVGSNVISTNYSFSNSTSYKYYKFIAKDGTRNCNKNGCTWGNTRISDIQLKGYIT